MAFEDDAHFLDNLPVSDKMIISSGPIIVYKTSDCKIENFRDKFEIIHGWSPLLLSTAKCFTRLVLSNLPEPVCAPIIWKLTVNQGVLVQLFTSSPVRPVIQESEECTVNEREISTEESVELSSAVASIFLADMKSFGEVVELRVNTDATIINEKIDLIVLKPGSSITISRVINASGDASLTP